MNHGLELRIEEFDSLSITRLTVVVRYVSKAQIENRL